MLRFYPRHVANARRHCSATLRATRTWIAFRGTSAPCLDIVQAHELQRVSRPATEGKPLMVSFVENPAIIALSA
jgi:hypothetical protein